MSHGQYILVGQTPVPADNLDEWGRWMQEGDRRVRLTQVGEWFVSTVFLGVDMRFGEGPPLLFETMAYREVEPYEVFGHMETRRFSDEIQERCATWMEAEAQHERIVTQIAQPDDVITQIEPEPIEILTTVKLESPR